MSEPLKRCPYCDCKTEVDVNSVQLVCLKCGLAGPAVSGQGDDCTAAIAAWNALPRRLRWTKEYPTKPGWYWYRRIYDKQTFDCHVKIWQDNYRNLKVESHQFDPTAESLWAGPIPEPLPEAE